MVFSKQERAQHKAQEALGLIELQIWSTAAMSETLPEPEPAGEDKGESMGQELSLAIR